MFLSPKRFSRFPTVTGRLPTITDAVADKQLLCSRVVDEVVQGSHLSLDGWHVGDGDVAPLTRNQGQDLAWMVMFKIS